MSPVDEQSTTEMHGRCVCLMPEVCSYTAEASCDKNNQHAGINLLAPYRPSLHRVAAMSMGHITLLNNNAADFPAKLSLKFAEGVQNVQC